MMTVDQLKEEADKLGYRLIRKSAPKIAVCNCNNRKPKQYCSYLACVKNIYFFCPNCSKKSDPMEHEEDAILNWNEKVADSE